MPSAMSKKERRPWYLLCEQFKWAFSNRPIDGNSVILDNTIIEKSSQINETK